MFLLSLTVFNPDRMDFGVYKRRILLVLEFVKKNFLEPETNYGGSLRDILKLEKV